MIDRLQKHECCGCNACGDVCPKNSITFKTDREGFLYPEIDHTTCIECGLCEKVCPTINVSTAKTNDWESPKCFAAIHKNLEIRFDSTSGGAFSALAKKAYLQKYHVGGAIWNGDWTVSQYVSNNKKDLERLRSSKYIQSDARGIYKQVKDLLDAGEKVLICGTPCQIAGLKMYLRKPYENLVTVDFICNYVNSPFVWRKYIDYLEKEHKSRVVYIKDKNKEIGWRTLCNKVVFENGEVVYDTRDKNYFRRCYMGLGIASRPSCYHCQYKGFPRVADITIADFWGVEKYLPQEFDNNLGTSLIMCNSKKGLDYFDESVRKYLNVLETDISNTFGANPALTKPYDPEINFSREQFYLDLEKSDLNVVVEDYFRKYKKSPNQLTFKRKIKRFLKFGRDVLKCSGFNLGNIVSNYHFNYFNKQVETDMLNGNYAILYPHTIIQMEPGSRIKIGGLVKIGENYYKKEKKYTKFLLRRNALLDVQGNYSFGCGSDIQIFHDAVFTIEGGGDTNMNVEIVCGKSMTFQKYVYLGRNVIIRDTNGEHFISRQGYKTSRPVVIGTHAWICDRAVVMPGVHVKPGGIVGAGSFVTSDVPAFSMVSGNPAIVVDEEVYWKA